MSRTALQKSEIRMLGHEIDSPHALLENRNAYSIVLNMLGIRQKDIRIGVDQAERELGVVARRESPTLQKGLFWIFNIPSDGLLENVFTRYRSGVLEVVIPRRSRS